MGTRNPIKVVIWNSWEPISSKNYVHPDAGRDTPGANSLKHCKLQSMFFPRKFQLNWWFVDTVNVDLMSNHILYNKLDPTVFNYLMRKKEPVFALMTHSYYPEVNKYRINHHTLNKILYLELKRDAQLNFVSDLLWYSYQMFSRIPFNLFSLKNMKTFKYNPPLSISHIFNIAFSYLFLTSSSFSKRQYKHCNVSYHNEDCEGKG